jgi:uncharacterized C2H2 Zn-finger protein
MGSVITRKVLYGNGDVEVLNACGFIEGLQNYVTLITNPKLQKDVHVNWFMLQPRSYPPHIETYELPSSIPTEFPVAPYLKSHNIVVASPANNMVEEEVDQQAVDEEPKLLAVSKVGPTVDTTYEDSIDDVACVVCKSADDANYMLLCDRCDDGYHTYCLNPPLLQIPEGDWYCLKCSLPKASYRCKNCQKSFKSLGGYKYHMKNICFTEQTPSTAKKASKSAPNPVEIDDGEVGNDDDMDEELGDSAKEEGTCPKCNKVFRSLNGLTYHLEKNACEGRASHKVLNEKALELSEVVEGEDGKKSYVCKRCGKSFISFGGVKYHVQNVCLSEEELQQRDIERVSSLFSFLKRNLCLRTMIMHI